MDSPRRTTVSSPNVCPIDTALRRRLGGLTSEGNVIGFIPCRLVTGTSSPVGRWPCLKFTSSTAICLFSGTIMRWSDGLLCRYLVAIRQRQINPSQRGDAFNQAGRRRSMPVQYRRQRAVAVLNGLSQPVRGIAMLNEPALQSNALWMLTISCFHARQHTEFNLRCQRLFNAR